MARSSSGVSPAFLLVFACSLWGGVTVLNKGLLDAVSPVTLLVLQLAPSAMILWLSVLVTQRPLPHGRALFIAIVLGTLNPGISYTLSLFGLQRIPASIASLLWATEPFMILMLAALVLGEPVTKRLLGIIAAGFLGVVLVTGLLGGAAGGANDGTGILLLTGAVLLCAVYTVYSRKISADNDPLAIVAVQQTAGLVWSVVLLAATSQNGLVNDIVSVPASNIALSMLSGLLYYALAYWLYLIALRHVPAAVAGSYFNVIPLVAIAIAFVFLGERLAPVQWVGALMIFASALALFRESGTGGGISVTAR